MTEQMTAGFTAVLRHYSLVGAVITGRHPAGIINDNWLVASATGERYFLRGYRRVRNPERVRFQLCFQEHLRENGFPTAAVVATRTGKPFATVDSTPWALFSYVDGNEFDFARLPQAEEAGRRLAQFHAIAAGYAGPDAPVVPGEVDFSNLLLPVSSHMWRDSVLAEEHDARLKDLFGREEFAADLAFFSDWRRRAAAAWPGERLAVLPRSWLHCDYHGRNMVFRGNGMTGLFDFDYATRGPRIFDVSRGIFNFGREKRGSTNLRESFCRAFLEGYESETLLSQEERESLGFMAVLNWAPDAAFYALRRVEEGNEGIARRLRFDVNTMQGIETEMRRLAASLAWGVI